MPPNRRSGSSWLHALLLLLASSWASVAAALPAATGTPFGVDPPRIGVITMEPGNEFWERFGHDAIVVQGADAVSYNFGFFDMSEPGFVANFIRGHMRYYLVALPLADDLASYRAAGRGVTVQWLDLDPSQARELAQALAVNARPENARYRYDYYADNCSTRVRDALDRALGGQLRKQLTGRSQGNTYRSESVRLAWPAKWMAFGFHLGMSGYGDRPLSRWDEAFIPMRLRDSLREVRRSDGRPLVSTEQVLLPHKLQLPPAELPRWRTVALFAGLAAALATAWLGRRRPRLVAALAMPYWLVSGTAGVVMLYLWAATAHIAGHGNENILVLSPLCLLLLPGAWQVLRGRAAPRWFKTLLWMVAASAAIAGFLKFLPFRPQENVEWVLLFLPMHLALARTFDPKSSIADDAGHG